MSSSSTGGGRGQLSLACGSAPSGARSALFLTCPAPLWPASLRRGAVPDRFWYCFDWRYVHEHSHFLGLTTQQHATALRFQRMKGTAHKSLGNWNRSRDQSQDRNHHSLHHHSRTTFTLHSSEPDQPHYLSKKTRFFKLIQTGLPPTDYLSISSSAFLFPLFVHVGRPTILRLTSSRPRSQSHHPQDQRSYRDLEGPQQHALAVPSLLFSHTNVRLPRSSPQLFEDASFLR